MTTAHRLTSLLALAVFLAAGPASAGLPRPGGLTLPVYAYIVPDGSLGEPCEETCLKQLASKIKSRRGVTSVEIEGDGLKLQIKPGVFKPDDVIKNVVGMKVEMRLPYEKIEVHFLDSASFPPASYLEGETLVVELSKEVHKAIDDAVSVKLPARMKCIGKASGSEANEAVLVRYQEEKRPPVKLVPFMAEADLDGDKRMDLYLNITSLPEMVIFNRASGLKAVSVTKFGGLDDIPRCDQTTTKFARAVPKKQIKCIGGKPPPHAGDAVERVVFNRSNELLMWHKTDGFVTCEPFGEGALPPPDDEKKNGED